jgi:4-carboxymuconolactone decarboxylase
MKSDGCHMNKHDLGIKRLKEIIGQDADAIIEKFSSVAPDFARYVIEFGYGDLYMRPGLSDKNRELAAVACLIGQGNAGLPLKAHIGGMLNVGWQKEEIAELITFLVGFSGFPACVDALGILKKVLEERNELAAERTVNV